MSIMKEQIEKELREKCSNCSYYKLKGYLKEDCLKCQINWYKNELISARQEIEKKDKVIEEIEKENKELHDLVDDEDCPGDGIHL